ncbi:MAG: UDP-N-acetylmuramate dehydrogenase [Leadbetterella sp.]
MIQRNISLKGYNTFGLDVRAEYFTKVESVDELTRILGDKNLPVKRLILGEGSNVLLLKDFDGIVIKNSILGIEVVFEDDLEVVLKVGAGENWHKFVLYCIENQWAGVENLSLIPGTVGAAPMQNIGAYGVEIKDVFLELQAMKIEDLSIHTFDLETCKFGYRESFFKREGKGKYIILNVSFRLKKKARFNTSYGVIGDTIKKLGYTEASIKAVSEAVIYIRKSKLPDPAEIGNSGSFFKNPEILRTTYTDLLNSYPDMPSYPIDDLTLKIPAGWMIEKAGWKGYRRGDVGVHQNQALVLVNFGDGTGTEIKNLALEIQEDILKKFGIEIHPEVNFID